MNLEKINNIFNSFKEKKILVIGDVMIDAYLWGDVNRISPEAPVQIVSCTGRENRIGGAGNVALNIKALGAEPILCSVIGNDENAGIFLDLLDKNNLKKDGIIKNKTRQTTVKTRIIGRGQQILRVDEESIEPLNRETENIFIDLLHEIILQENIVAIITEDYDKGVITSKIINYIAKISKNKIITLIDPKKRNFTDFKNFTLFKPNLKEFTEGLNINILKDNYTELFKTSKKYLEESGNKNIMITLSENGIFIADKNNWYHEPAHIRDIIDVSGAGDTVISVTTMCLLAGLNNKDIISIVNIAGGLVCEKSGVVPIDAKKLKSELQKNNLSVIRP